MNDDTARQLGLRPKTLAFARFIQDGLNFIHNNQSPLESETLNGLLYCLNEAKTKLEMDVEDCHGSVLDDAVSLAIIAMLIADRLGCDFGVIGAPPL